MRSSRWSPHLLVIFILPFILFWRWVIKGQVLYWGTLLFQFWPWHQLVKTSLLNGDWPLWNPLLGNGTPLLANLQSAVFYPPNLLYVLMPVEHGLTLSIILHLILAGASMYLYARRLGLLPFAATLAALTFMFSGYLVGRTQFVPMVNAAAWIPIILLLYENLLASPPFSRASGLNILGLGLALAMPLLAGHAQLWFYTLWLIGTYAVFRSLQMTSPRWLALVQAIWQLAMAMVITLLLAAVQILPTLEFILQSARRDGAERFFALTYSFWPWRLLTLLAPEFFGHPAKHNYWGYANYWEDHAYVGILPLLLALVAVWYWVRRKIGRAHQSLANADQRYWRVIPFFAVLIPISLVLAMGWNTPLYLWIYDHVPGFEYFQAPARLLIWYTVAVAILAGAGAQIFETSPVHRPLWRRLLAGGIALTAAGLAGSVVIAGRSQTFLVATVTSGIWLILSIGLLLLQPDPQGQPARSWRRPSWQWAAIGVVATNLLWAAWPLIPTLPPAIFNQTSASAKLLRTRPEGYRFFVSEPFEYEIKFNHYFRFDTFGPSDIDHWQGLHDKLVPNLGVYAELPAANNDDPLKIGHWQQFTRLLQKVTPQQRANLLGLMNVGYLIDYPGQKIGPMIDQQAGMAIYGVPTALPRAHFVPKVFPVRDQAEAIARLTAVDFDSRQELVIMEKEPEPNLPLAQTNTGGQITEWPPVTVKERGTRQVSLTVDAPGPGFVLLTDTFYPGWHATVDGYPTRIYQANLAFRAVAVDAGTHDIVFSYRPLNFKLGLWLSTTALLAIVVIGSALLKYGAQQ